MRSSPLLIPPHTVLISHATDLTRKPPSRPVIPSPQSHDGTLDELWEGFIEPNTPTPAVVADFHRALADYVREPTALLLIRNVGGLQRREEYATGDGTRIRMTDNAPAWWVHYALLQGASITPGAFGPVIESIPAHFFDVARMLPASANRAGWHVAHILAVKDRSTDHMTWRRPEAVGRFVRNIHPCNHFLVPKPGWQRWGGDPRVIAFFAEKFAARYVDVWDEFIRMARADPKGIGRVSGPITYTYSSPASPSLKPIKSNVTQRPPARALDGRVAASYQATRLLFKRSVIEPLNDDDVFQVVTPNGTFEMSKAEFVGEFSNVCASASYRDHGVYHYSTLPKKALRFLVLASQGRNSDAPPL